MLATDLPQIVDAENCPHVVTGQRWKSLDPRDEGLTATVLSTSGPGGFVTIQRFRRTRVRFERFVKAYELVER